MDDEHLPDCCHCASYSFGSRHKLNLVWPGSSDFYCKLIQLTTSISNICFNSDLARHQRVKKPLSLLLALHKCRQENGRYFFFGLHKIACCAFGKSRRRSTRPSSTDSFLRNHTDMQGNAMSLFLAGSARAGPGQGTRPNPNRVGSGYSCKRGCMLC